MLYLTSDLHCFFLKCCDSEPQVQLIAKQSRFDQRETPAYTLPINQHEPVTVCRRKIMQNTIDKIYAAWASLERELQDAGSGKRGWKTAAARARKKSFEVEKLMKEFARNLCDCQRTRITFKATVGGRMPKVEFKTGQTVIVRNATTTWTVDLFSYYEDGTNSPYVCTGHCKYDFCLPFNVKTEHMVGTRADPPVDESTRFKCGQWVEVEYNGGERATALYLRYETQDSGANHQFLFHRKGSAYSLVYPTQNPREYRGNRP